MREDEHPARETATLDHLSRGRLTLGVGLGSADNLDFEPFGEVTQPRQRAELLDQGLDRLSALWGGEFEPRPVQRPRIPVWVAAQWPNRRPLRRAARWDGLFPIDLDGPDALAVLAREVAKLRGESAGVFELVVDIRPHEACAPWEKAGATWVLTDFDSQPRLDEVREVIDAGPDH